MFCFSCKKDVISKEKEACKDNHHDLDYEGLNGPWKIKEQKVVRVRPDAISATDDILKHTYMASVGEKQTLWYWDNKNLLWVPEGKIYLLTILKQKHPDATSNDFKEVIFEVQARTTLRDSQFKPSQIHIQCNKTVLNLETLNEEETDPLYYISKKLDTPLSKVSLQPWNFLKALVKVQPDPQQRFLLLEAFACLLLVRTQDIDKIFLFVGEGQNGKSTILSVINRIFEPYISAVSMHDLIENRFALGELEDMLGNIYADISGIKIKDANVLKLLTSGDLINIDRKYEKMRKIRISIVQFYSANKLPEIEDRSLAIARRMVPIEFTQKIKITDATIKQKLEKESERTAILNLLVRIAKFVKTHGLLYTPGPEEVLSMLEEKGNAMVQFLLSSGYVRAKVDKKAEKDLLYSVYARFCQKKKFIVRSKHAFSSFIMSKSYVETRSGNVKYWQGLEINQDMINQEPNEQTLLRVNNDE